MEFFIYMSIAFCGYFAVPINTPEIFIDRKNDWGNDLVMTIGKIALTFTILLAFVVNYICCKISIINLVCKSPEDFTKKKNIFITLGIIIFTTLVGVLYSKVTPYISFLGGLLAVILTYLVPTMIHVKITHFPLSSPRVFIPIIISGLLTLCGWTAAVLVLKDIITN